MKFCLVTREKGHSDICVNCRLGSESAQANPRRQFTTLH